MLSASHRLGYKDKETGEIVKLPLATTDYDPEITGTSMYKKGYEMFIWEYCIRHGTWGKALPWIPSDVVISKSKNEHIIDGSGNERGIRNLNVQERKQLMKMLRQGKTLKEMADTMKMDRHKVSVVRTRFRKGELKK